MTAAPAPRLMTADELLGLPDDGYHHYELVRGELICMSPSAFIPGMVIGLVIIPLGVFVREHRLGVVGTGEAGFRLASDPDTVRAPDAWFVRAGRVPTGKAGEKFFAGPPDLAIEVLSPSDRYKDVMAKVRDYLAAGTPLVWVIDPMGRTAGAFGPGMVARLLDEDGVLDGGDVLPGFALPLRDILPPE
jgi:Uma2 family endonuclease